MRAVQAAMIEELESYMGVILEAVPRILDGIVDAHEEECQDLKKTDLLYSFRAEKVPQISLTDYFARFHEFSDSSAACYLLTLVYIDRMVKKCQVHITEDHIHRLVLTSWVVASKFAEDERYTNSLYARIGGLKQDGSLNNLEVDFLVNSCSCS